jgi:acetyl esterase/lipase
MSVYEQLQQGYYIITGILIYFTIGPPRKSWTLEQFLVVYILRNTMFGKVDDLDKGRKKLLDLGISYPKDSQLKKATIHSKYRQQAHEIVKEHLKTTYGDDAWYDEISLWSNSKPLEAEWLIPNHLALTPESNIIFYLFGGGHVFGDFCTYRSKVEVYANISDSIVFGASYRLAPEYSAPCQLEDLIAQILYLTSPIDENNPDEGGCGIRFDQIVVAGDSAGGNLSSVLLHFMRDTNFGKFAGAVLYSPWLDVSGTQSTLVTCQNCDYLPEIGTVTPSRGHTLDDCDGNYRICHDASNEQIRNAIIKRGHIYVPIKYVNSPLASPLSDTNFRDLPPILIATGDSEVLHLDTVLYHEAINKNYTEDELDQAQIPPVTTHFYEDMFHCFQNVLPELDVSKACFNRVGHFIKQCFNTKSAKFDEIKNEYPINISLVNSKASDKTEDDHKWTNFYFNDLKNNLAPFKPNFKTNPILPWGSSN